MVKRLRLLRGMFYVHEISKSFSCPLEAEINAIRQRDDYLTCLDPIGIDATFFSQWMESQMLDVQK